LENTFFVIEASLSLAIFNGDFSTLGDKLSKLGNSVIFFYAIIYTLTFAACVGIVLTEKTRISNKLNQELKQRQTEDALALSKQSMQLMQSQLSPHFLFNCLGAISGLARNGQTDALVDATARVGDLLRFTISNSSSSFISLDEELAFIQDYITLQKLRFAERFNYTCNINLPDQPVLCPPFSIQPLIENVFCHAVEAQDETTEVNLIISYGCEHISIIVRNSAAANPTEIQSNGTGIQNLRCRLTHLYGTEFNLVLSQNESEFSAELLLPLKSQTHMNRVFDNV
jgi:LytS/YehU family sensor histidine kinase